MSYTSLTNKVVEIRKPHKCIMCNTKYEPPTRMRYNAGVYDGVMQSTYLCEICDAFMTPEKWQDCDHEISERDAWEYEDYKSFREQFKKLPKELPHEQND